MKLLTALIATSLVALGQDSPTLFIGKIVSGGETNIVVFNKPVTSITWETNPPPPAPPTNGQGGLTVDIPGFTNWNIPKTNSAIAHPERKRKIIAYRKECPECGVSLTSTNITTWLVTEETNSFRMVSVAFECLGCDERYVEVFKRPIRKTKVEEVSIEVVK